MRDNESERPERGRERSRVIGRVREREQVRESTVRERENKVKNEKREREREQSCDEGNVERVSERDDQ